jgi:hypothetical protein
MDTRDFHSERQRGKRRKRYVQLYHELNPNHFRTTYLFSTDTIISELREENDALKRTIESMHKKQAKETTISVTNATALHTIDQLSSGHDVTPQIVSAAKTEKQSSFAEKTENKIETSTDSSGDGDEEGQKLWQQTIELQKRIKEALKWVASSQDNIRTCIYVSCYVSPIYRHINASINTFL